MEEGSENIQINIFESSVSELQLSTERSLIFKEGFLSAKQSKDLLQARLISGVWSSKSMTVPQEVQELTRNLEQEWEGGTINVKFDTQLEDETVTDEEEILFRKIQRCTNQNERLKSGEGRVFAVVIPSYWREEEGLPRTLDSIREQRFDDAVIVVVSDNNDEEGRKKFDIGRLSKTNGANVATGSVEGNIASARRKGIDRAKNNLNNLENLIIVGLDSDTIAQSSFLNEVRDAFKDESVVAWTDRLNFGDDTPEELKNFENSANEGRKDLIKRTRGCILSGAMHAVRADVYKAVGGHTLDYVGGEDLNLSEKIYQYIRQQKALEGKTLKMRLSDKGLAVTSPRKFLDEDGHFSRERTVAILEQWHEFGRNVARTEEIAGKAIKSRKITERLSRIKNMFNRGGVQKIRDGLIRRRKLDGDFQRTVNLPEVRNATLEETKEARMRIDETIEREIIELQNKHPNLEINPESNFYLSGLTHKDEEREMLLVIRRSPNPDKSFKYTAVQIERKYSHGGQPETYRIYSWAEIDPNNPSSLTRLYWADEDPYFHPDDQYPRVASLLFNTYYNLISKAPTQSVDVEIRPLTIDAEVSEKLGDRLTSIKKAVENAKQGGIVNTKIRPVESILSELELTNL